MKNECEYCGTLDNEHRCIECEEVISEKQCKETWGLCYHCLWVLGL